MLRESRARWLAFATAGVVVGLAVLFAWLRNPPADLPRAHAAPPDDARLAAGRAAFVRLDCVRCHSLAGVGNPAAPLDGVGSRLDAAALRDWALGTGVAAEQMPRGIVRIKARVAEDPDIDMLIEYLAQSR
jgi:mono/diheme cytochrome c family protein